MRSKRSNKKNKRKSYKFKKQYGRGIIDGINGTTNINGNTINYIKKCPDGFVMCDKDEVNAHLCVKSQDKCSNAFYNFKYIPPDDNDRDGINPSNRYLIETNGMGPIQGPGEEPIEKFEVKYLGSDDEERRQFEEELDLQDNTGRQKSYAKEYFPTSCAVQQKTAATIDVDYTQSTYKRRSNVSEINIMDFSPIPNNFKIATQNALGLYRGEYNANTNKTPETEYKEIATARKVDAKDDTLKEKWAKQEETHAKNEATFNLMRLRTALFRDFLRQDQPDFVCIQESTRTFINLLDQQDIPDLYPYIYPTEDEMVNQERNGANATTSLLSRHPAKKSTTYMLQGNSSYFNALGVYEFDNLVIFNVYMQAGSEISPGQKYQWENYARCRRQQLMFIKAKIDLIKRAPGDKAIIVLGDFNFELNSVRYQGETGRPPYNISDLVYDPTNSNMNWAEHKFLVGDNGLNLNDSYKQLHINNSDDFIREGYTEFTDINTFRFLGKLEEKTLRYDGIFYNNSLIPLSSNVINNRPTILDSDDETIDLFRRNGIIDYQDNIRNYNEQYDKFMIFNPKGNISAFEKKMNFLNNYNTYKGKKLTIDFGYELFVSDHFGVMTEFTFSHDGVTKHKGGLYKSRRPHNKSRRHHNKSRRHHNKSRRYHNNR
jgi:hypothetical protein